MAYMEIASIAIRIVPTIRLYDQNLKGLGAKVFALISLQSVKRLQLDQAAHWCVICGSYSYPRLDGGLGEERGFLLPPPLLFLPFTNLHFDAYCCSCDTFWCEVSITSAWLCSKMRNKLLPPSFCACCAHCRCVCGCSTASTQGCGLRVIHSTEYSQLSVSNIFLYFLSSLSW